MSAAQLPPGTVIDGRYTLGDVVRSRLGAAVYAATDAEGNAADVTVYAADCFPSALVRERSLRELRQLQSVDSPRIVSVLGCGKRDDGGAYEVTAPMRDPMVTEALARGPWPEADAAALLVQVGEALLVAQKVGVIHRNLGPTIIHAGPNGACLGGFAVGEPHGDGAFGPSMTIAPEQVDGKIVDQRTLIFNLAALMQTMLGGAALYDGHGIEVLRAYVQSEPDAATHAGLKRALSRDPRMRPMMLRQFLGELGAIGGVAGPSSPSASGPTPAAPAGATPTSRGWTMFMKDDAADAPAGPAGPAGTPAAPAAAPAAAKPSTRGWTMFMEAAGDDPPAKDTKEEAAPAPVAEAKPSTRGWTMFMEAADDDAEPKPSEGAQPAEPAQPAQSAAPADGDKPSTRGWTMFMEADEGDEATPSSEAPTGPAQQAAAATAEAEAAVDRTQVAAAPAAEEPAKAGPSTRGWTMFMEDEEGDAPAADAPAAAAAPAVAPAAAAATPSAAPASSGWTMFKEPSEPMPPLEADGGAAQPDVAPAAAAAPAAEAPAAEAPAAENPAADGADKPAAKKRGWTMFMEAPLPKQGDGKTIGGPNRVDPPGGAPEPAATPSPATAATQKGWTVFGAEAELGKRVADVPPAAQPAEPEAPAPTPQPAGPATARPRVSTVVSNPNIAKPAGPSPDLTMPAPGASPDVTMPTPPSASPAAVAAPESPTAGAKTVIATGLDARAGAAGGVTSRAELPGAEGANDPVSGVGAPHAIAPRASTEIAKQGSNKGLLIGVAAVVVVGGAAAAWFLLGGG